MTTQQARDGKPAVTLVTTNTGRILRVNPADPESVAAAASGAASAASPRPGHPGATPNAIVDPARRADVLFRVRRDEGHELSSWWMIGAFLATTAIVIALLGGVPGSA